jgi:hypothetical protein
VADYQYSPRRAVPLEKKWAEWAVGKYGSVQAALDYWQVPRYGVDDVEKDSILHLFSAWFMTREGLRIRHDRRIRIEDQLEFLVQEQKGFFDRTAEWLHNDLGVQCGVIGTSLRTAERDMLDAIDRYTNTGCDVMDHHTGFSGPQKSIQDLVILPGHQFRDRLALREPEALPVRDVSYEGYPQTNSYYRYPMVNRYRTEGPILAAAYGSLQGTDAFMFATVNDGHWETISSTWPLMTPVTFGQFPAFALAYRRGLIAEADVVVRQVLSVEGLLALEGSMNAVPQYDQTGQQVMDAKPDIDPLAFLVGRVVRSFGDPHESEFIDLSPYLDREAQRVSSTTGEVALDFGRGCLTVNAPGMRAADGLLGECGRLDLGGVTIDVASEYGCVAVVSLTDEPIESSPRLLLQVMTEEKNSGWATQPAPEDLTMVSNAGMPPLLVREAEGSVRIARPDADRLRVTPLSLDGYAREGAVTVEARAGALTIALLPDCTHYLIEAGG